MIKKTSETTPTMASIVNATNSSTTDAYSCDYINDLVDYSTTETKTGAKWIDGKPIYRKVINDTTTRNAGVYNIAHGISNLGDIVDLKLFSWQNATTMFIGSTSSLNASDKLAMYLNGENISIRNSWECVKVVIIIEYTKTTD